jgi:hypothetical protein
MQEIKDIKKEIEQRLRQQEDTPLTIQRTEKGYKTASIPAELRIDIYRHDKFNEKGELDTWASEYEVVIRWGKTKYEATGLRYLDDATRFITKILGKEE